MMYTKLCSVLLCLNYITEALMESSDSSVTPVPIIRVLTPSGYTEDTRYNILTVKAKAIALNCFSNQPVDWTYTGVGVPGEYVEVVSLRTNFQDSIIFQNFISIKSSIHTIGNYTCFHASDQKPSFPNTSSVYLIFKGDGIEENTFMRLGNKNLVNIEYNLSNVRVILPCPSTSAYINATLNIEGKIRMMMEIGEGVEEPSALLRLDTLCLRTAIVNYSEAELKGNNTEESDSDTISVLRSWACVIWLYGFNVLLRSDPNQYSFQFLQLFSQYGSGWTSVDLSNISWQGSLKKSLSVLDSHGLILVDQERNRIKIQGLNLLKEIQGFNCQFDMELTDDFFKLLNTATPTEKQMSRSSQIGLTSVFRLVLRQPDIKLSPGLASSFDLWAYGFTSHPSQALTDEEKWVMSTGIELYEGVGSLHFRSLEIRLHLRSVLRSTTDGQDKGSNSKGARVRNNLDLIMSKAKTYMAVLDSTIHPIGGNEIHPNPNPQIQANFHHYPDHFDQYSLYKITKDCAAVGESLRQLTLALPSTLTPYILGLLEQLTTFFKSGWNSWKHLETERQNSYGDKLGCVCFAGILDCLSIQGKEEEILGLVKETKDYLTQLPLPRIHQFKTFFPKWVTGHALSLGPESRNRKESLLLELEEYLMGIYMGRQDNNHNHLGYDEVIRFRRLLESQVDQVVLPHLFNCLAQLGRYETLHRIMEDLNLRLQSWTTEPTANCINPYVQLPSALVDSVKGMNFRVKESLMEETFGLAKRLVKMMLEIGVYEYAHIRKLSNDPMEALINFCFENGMAYGLTGFLEEMEESSLVNTYGYGMNSIGPITTTILYFGERVADGLEQMDPVKMTHSDWNMFLKKVKRCVVKWTQLISTPQHAHEKLDWMDGIAESVSKRFDSSLDLRSRTLNIARNVSEPIQSLRTDTHRSFVHLLL